MKDFASNLMAGGFRDAHYIGRVLIDKELGKHHKIFYIGYFDAFGVSMPHPSGKYDFQIWAQSWVLGRCKKLDAAIDAAMKGKFSKHRHNVQIKLRANSHGRKFIKPEWKQEKNAPPVIEKKVKFETRGRRRKAKRVRRPLNI